MKRNLQLITGLALTLVLFFLVGRERETGALTEYAVIQEAVQIAAASEIRADDDSLAASRERNVAALLDRLGERKMNPAGEVFDSLDIFQRVPAERLLRIMDQGFSRSLGVGCEHCHDTEVWSSNTKRPKRAAREMVAMVRVINDSLLARIGTLDSDRSTVNCTTCHRGQIEPALNLPDVE